MALFSTATMRGLLAARPASSAGTAGRLYYATDTSTLYRDSGTTWESVEGTLAAHTHTEADITDLQAYATAADLTAHLNDTTTNPHEVTAAQVGAMTNPMTTQADIIAGGADGVPVRLAKGANNTVLGVDGFGVFGYKADPSGGSGGHTIEDEGTPLTARSKLNFVGAGVAVTDDSGDDATVVTISGGGGGGGAEDIDDLSDVDITTEAPAVGDTLKWDGAKFVPSSAMSVMRVVHLDAGAGITKDGSDLVSAWTDQSLFGNSAVQATATNQPLWVASVINGEPVVRFDGVDNYMTINIPALDYPTFTLATVLRPRDAPSFRGLLSWSNALSSATPFLNYRRHATNMELYMNSTYRSPFAHATDAAKLYVLTFTGAVWTLYVNGVSQFAYVGGETLRASATTIYLGNGYNGYGYVEIPAVELFNRALSSTERGVLETRLMTKYGL